jgi:cytochrome c
MQNSYRLALMLTCFLAGSSSIPVFAAPVAGAGEALFRQRCQICHSVIAAAPSGVGPNLSGVVGRNAGAAVFNYSPALKASKLPWTKPNLDRFITAPSKTVPGTRMVIALSDAKQRKLVIDYLSSLK